MNEIEFIIGELYEDENNNICKCAGRFTSGYCMVLGKNVDFIFSYIDKPLIFYAYDYNGIRLDGTLGANIIREHIPLNSNKEEIKILLNQMDKFYNDKYNKEVHLPPGFFDHNIYFIHEKIISLIEK